MSSQISNPASRQIFLVVQRLRTSRVIVAFIRIINYFEEWSLVQQFTLVSLIIMLLGMIGIGRWIGQKIENGFVKETTATTALYMDSFVSPNIQELSYSNSLTSEHIRSLNNLFSANEFARKTVAVKIWGKDHRIVYSNIPALVGRKFTDTEDQIASWNGNVTGEISTLQDAENVEERKLGYQELFQVYSPVRESSTHKIIAVAEFYQKVDDLRAEIAAVQRLSWLRVGLTMSTMYLLLISFMRWAGNQITLQESELKNRVAQLNELLAQNKQLSEGVRSAAANTAELHEMLLRRTSSEIHDGPVQEVSMALLRLDRAIEHNESCRLVNPNSKCNESLPAVQSSLQAALQEMRAIAAGLGLPQLERLTLPEIVTRVVRSHENRTRTTVNLNMENLPDQAALPIKITAYRMIQEALNNAYQHAEGKGQTVKVTGKPKQLQIIVSDDGPGFDINQTIDWPRQIGLAGLQERVESLGGLFKLDSKPYEGAKLIVYLPLPNGGGN